MFVFAVVNKLCKIVTFVHILYFLSNVTFTKSELPVDDSGKVNYLIK